jgi:hypothetical protein
MAEQVQITFLKSVFSASSVDGYSLCQIARFSLVVTLLA